MLRQIWHILIFAKILYDYRVLQSLRSQVSLLSAHQQVFFSQFLSIGPFLKFDYYPVSTYDFSPTGEAQSLDTAVLIVDVSHIPLRLVSEQTGMIYFIAVVQQYPVRVQQYYCLFTALPYNCGSIIYTARRKPYYQV